MFNLDKVEREEMMRKLFFEAVALCIILCTSSLVLAADKVVVIPLNTSNVTFEGVNHRLTIPGTSFYTAAAASS